MEKEADYTNQFTADFVNDDPVVFRGLTDTEIRYVLMIGVTVGVPVGVIAGVVTGVYALILVFVIILPVISIYFIAGWVEKFRRGKPMGYIEQLAIRKLQRISGSADFVFESEMWSLGRTRMADKNGGKRG